MRHTETSRVVAAGFSLRKWRTLKGAANGITFAGQRHAFLLTPAPVPEPASLLLVGSGLLGLVGWKRKRS